MILVALSSFGTHHSWMGFFHYLWWQYGLRDQGVALLLIIILSIINSFYFWNSVTVLKPLTEYKMGKNFKRRGHELKAYIQSITIVHQDVVNSYWLAGSSSFSNFCALYSRPVLGGIFTPSKTRFFLLLFMLQILLNPPFSQDGPYHPDYLMTFYYLSSTASLTGGYHKPMW